MTKAEAVYGGADVHGSNVFISLCDAQGKTVFKKRVKPKLEAVTEALSPYRDRLHGLGVESTYNWYWIVDGLREQDYPVHLGNPAKMQQYKGIKQTNDLTDAAWLAEMERLDIFPSCYIYPKEIRGVRDALRRRQMFVRQRTQSLLSLEGLLARYGLEIPSVYRLKRWTDEDIQSTGLGPYERLQIGTLLESIQKAEELIAKIEKSVQELVGSTADFHRIRQVTGIGMILGLTILLESGDFSRFPSAGNYASYARAVKSERGSNGKKKGENNAKNGNPHLEWAFIEAATFAIRYDPTIRSWYERKKRRSKSVIARKALACKLAKAVWHVMNGKDFDVQLLFG